MNTSKMIFVFGSNEAGIHGAGAAAYARKERGIMMGQSYGHYGTCFAIPTKDHMIETLDLKVIKAYVEGFLAFARGRYKMKFQVTAIGCGLAGYHAVDIAKMFDKAPDNCYFDTQWQQVLGDKHNYWGTFTQ